MYREKFAQAIPPTPTGTYMHTQTIATENIASMYLISTYTSWVISVDSTLTENESKQANLRMSIITRNKGASKIAASHRSISSHRHLQLPKLIPTIT